MAKSPEEIGREYTAHYISDNTAQSVAKLIAAAIREDRAEPVSECWPHEAWAAGRDKWAALDRQAHQEDRVLGTRIDILKQIVSAIEEAARQAKTTADEKGGAR